MVRLITLTIGLITLVQYIDAIPMEHGYIVHATDSINLTYYQDFRDKELRVSLIKGLNKSEPVCVGSFNSNQTTFQDNYCLVTRAACNVTFYLWGLTAKKTDIYFFKKELMYPPPYRCEYDNGTIIHIKEPACPKEEIQNTKIKFSYSPFIALGCIALYSIIITTAFVYIVSKGRKTRIQQSEYINVVPRRPRPHLSCITYATTPVVCNSR